MKLTGKFTHKVATILASVFLVMSLGAAMQSCSINGTRQINEDCLQTRECVAGLICAPNAANGDNRLKCTFTVDGSRPVTDSPTVADSPTAPAVDAGTD